jgi:WD40 repeat protein
LGEPTASRLVFGTFGNEIYEVIITRVAQGENKKKLEVSVSKNAAIVTKGHYFNLTKEGKSDQKDESSHSKFPPVKTSQVRGLVAIPQSNGKFASVSEDGSMCIWDSKVSSEVTRVNFKEPANCVTFTRDGKLLAVGFKNVNGSVSVRVYQYKDGKVDKLG